MCTVIWSLHSLYSVSTECFGSGSSCWFMLLQRFYWLGLPTFLTAVKIRVLCCTYLGVHILQCNVSLIWNVVTTEIVTALDGYDDHEDM
jgi:hypothetical protein